MAAQLSLSDPIPLRSTHGRISFGGTVHHQVVSWSAPDALDILVSQIWRGIYLYPSMSLSPEELKCEPLKVCEPFAVGARAVAVDWNHDGEDELIVAGVNTILYLADRTAGMPHPFFVNSGPLRGKDDGLVISIPYDNPHNQMDELGGYSDNRFLNTMRPVLFPVSSPQAIDLIVGDWAGNLWSLPDQSRGQGRPYYDGEEYEKHDPTRPDQDRFIQRFGSRYLRPWRKIADPEGKPLRFEMNKNVAVQALDVDGDGLREIIAYDGGTRLRLADDEDDKVDAWTSEGKVYTLARDAIALKDTGLRLPHFRYNYLVDIDGDGKPELVDSGGEKGLGFYRKIGLR